MARGKDRGAPLGGAGVGPPPTAASSALPRRITRATSGHPAAGNLRAPEAAAAAAAGKQRAPGSAAAAAVGKQTDLRAGAGAAPALPAAPVRAAAGVSKEEVAFVNKFLSLINKKPRKLYKLYTKDAVLDWNLNGLRIELKTYEIIRNYLSDALPHMQFHAADCKVQSIVGLNSAMLTMHGTCEAIDRRPRIFVQTLVLQRPDLLILSDSLTVLFLNVPEIDISKKPHVSMDRCAVCHQKWHSTDPKSWVRCDNCWTWLHIECDPLYCEEDLEVLRKSKYMCPDCMPQFQSVLAVEHTSIRKLAKPIPVRCLDFDGLYMPEQNKVSCQCKDCLKEHKMMSMNVWEKHSGSRKKNWKLCIYLRDTDDLLSDFLRENPGGSLKLSTTPAEINPSVSLKSSTTRAETCEYPAVRCLRTMNNKSESNFCILHDYDGMRWHQDKDSDHVNEKASRVLLILKKLKEDGVLDRIVSESFGMANRRLVFAVHHDVNYMSFIDSLPMSTKELKLKFGQFAGGDIFSSMGTPQAAYLAAGAFIRGCELVVGGCYDQAFAVVRPPGHHADKTFAEGFCYLNNVAIGAQHLLDHYGVKRILVVDFDVHHGNGTQEIFYESNEVLFFSCHSKDLGYPVSRSKESDIGAADGVGYNVNFPYPEGFKDDDLIYAAKEVLIPVATVFKPEVVLVSAGYDAGIGDIGRCEISSKCFGTIARMLLPLAGGRMVLALEGGYNLDHLPTHVSHTIRAILGDEDAFFLDPDHTPCCPRMSTITIAENLKKALRPYWSIFVEKPPGPTPGGEAPRPGGVGGDPSRNDPAPNVASGRNDPAPDDPAPDFALT